MRNNRNQSFQSEQIGKVRWCLTIIGVAFMASPMVLTNDHVAISAVHTVQALCLSLAGLLLVKLQAEAVFCKPR